MKRKFTLYSLIVSTLGFIMMSGTLNQSGPGAGYTHGPGESNCTSCHSGSLVTSGSNWSAIRLTGNFPSGGYVPDSVYQVEISYRQAGISKFGFQVMPLVKSNNLPAGSISVSSNRVQRYTRNVSGETRQYVGHTNAGTASVATDSTRWFFEWKAPSSNVGDVSFYVVVMATNNNNNNSGDVVYARTFDVPINAVIPTARIQASDTVVCTGSTLSFQGSGNNNPTQYNWSFTGAQQSTSTQQNPSVRFTSAGIQTVILTTANATASSKPDTFFVRVLQSPSASIPGSSLRVSCIGDSIALVANQVANARYTWIPTQETTRQIWAKSSGNYLVTVTDTITGCVANSNQVSVLFNAVPQTPILTTKSGTTTYCNTALDSLLAQTNAADTFIWYLPSQTLKTTTPSIALSLANSAQIIVEAKRQPSCVAASAPLSLTVVKPQIPTLNARNITQDAAEIVWNNTGTRYAVSIDSLRSFTSFSSDTTFQLSQLQPNTPYKIYVKTELAAPCVDSIQSIVVTTAPCSAIDFKISATNSLCLGDSFKLIINGLANTNYGVAFNNGPFGKDTLFSSLPLTNGNLRIDIIDSAVLSCPVITRFENYNLTEALEIETVIPSIINVCSNDAFALQFTLAYDSIWFIRNEAIVQKGTNKNYILSNANDGDRIKAILFNGPCRQETSEGVLHVTPALDPTFSFTRDHKTYQFVAVDTTASTYFWKIGNDWQSNDRNPIRVFETMNQNINVKLVLTKNEVCVDSSEQSLTLPDVTSIASIQKPQITVGPNPLESHLYIGQTMFTYKEYTLYTAQGKIIRKGTLQNANESILLPDLTCGIYTLKLSSEKEGTQQIVKLQKL